MKPYIYITRKLPAETIVELTEQFEVKMWEHEDIPAPREVLLAEAKKASGMITMLSDKIDEELLSAGENLKVVANLAVGFDNINLKSATERGIVVSNTPDVLTETTADLTFALLMAAARRIVEAADYIKAGKWEGWSPYLLAGHDVYGKTIGIVGMGKIGKAVARRANGFGMDILYHNRSRKPEAEKELGAVYSSFEDLVSKADYVVSLAPLTDETRNLFTADVFAKMKKSAIFINAGRGPVVDEQALYEALKSGEIAAAGLDVFEKEPISTEHPLLELSNVTAIPHIGSASTETRTKMIKLCCTNVKAVLTGDSPKTIVNKEVIQ
ncbi:MULTISPECIES: D-glycerate dehydrogenase [unclassified Mesobacillus]|uniref:2-hydroxyacid dehydrogenase n=1 Tax=unclassified Mesobacillus TaxID=2675270 RepID=UPI002041D2CA|nr:MULTISPECIES: D-glycerate dehydrogenase [unclassified Mesobacillus]MCM3123931.1 D-glycerate dehydrogenase [Mesobacillus sp. MER 33]MCM3233780.1 D-glycerate dehydrogenase [Mesobacillus sp. MER 48]